jgi:hypothetical protein
MTLAATRRYAFGASVVLGVAATLVAMALLSILIGHPEQVVLALGDAEMGALFGLILDRLMTAARAVLSLL